jgi:hypothetical protein
MIVSFCKTGPSVFLSHLSLIEVFFSAFIRAKIAVVFTGGFNPMPKLDFASPAPVGLTAENEIASIDLCAPQSAAAFTAALNAVLPEGLRLNAAFCARIARGDKKISAASILWGFAYKRPDTGTLDSGALDYVPAAGEKAYRQQNLEAHGSLLKLTRAAVLAKPAPAPTPSSSSSPIPTPEPTPAPDPKPAAPLPLVQAVPQAPPFLDYLDFYKNRYQSAVE